MRRFPPSASSRTRRKAQQEIHYKDTSAIERRDQAFHEASSHSANAFAESFMTAASPGIISKHDDERPLRQSRQVPRLRWRARLGKEYQAIHKAGLILQIDAPDLAMDRTMMYRDLSDARICRSLRNSTSRRSTRASPGIPRDRVRLHVCCGNWEGPHIHDVAAGRRSCPHSTRRMSALCRSSSQPALCSTNTQRVQKVLCPRTHPLILGVIETTSNLR